MVTYKQAKHGEFPLVLEIFGLGALVAIMMRRFKSLFGTQPALDQLKYSCSAVLASVGAARSLRARLLENFFHPLSFICSQEIQL